jgi:hypothetical protein
MTRMTGKRISVRPVHLVEVRYETNQNIGFHSLVRASCPWHGVSSQRASASTTGAYNPCEKVLNVNNVGKLSLKWSYYTGLGSPSSPAVANGVVYVGTLYPDDKVYALNASLHSLVPLTTTPACWKHEPTVSKEASGPSQES